MKDPANYIVIDSAGVELYCDDRGAPSLDGYVIGGPDRAVRQVRHAANEYERVQGFHPFCEGAVLVDLRRRVLGLFSGYLSDYAERAALRAVVAQTWPGWETRWAYGGLSDMRRYLGAVGSMTSKRRRPRWREMSRWSRSNRWSLQASSRTRTSFW